MKSRRVFSTDSVAAAREAIAAACRSGVKDEDVSLVARADIELESIPERHKESETDFRPAAIKGASIGGATGLLAGIAAVVIPPFGVTLAGAAVMTVLGAAVGTWSAALMGSSLPDPVRRKFEDEIESGRILVVLDAEDDRLPAVEAAVAATGARPLPYSSADALTE
jgi:hypothetical protein